jgi:hypothetical protein
VPRAFSDAIERATAKDRADRQSSAAMLASELRAALDSAPASQNAGQKQALELMETVALGRELDTKSDVNAPTMITMDGASATSMQADRPASTNASTVFEPAPPVSAPAKAQPSMPAGTVAESASMPSIATIPQVPASTAEIPPAVSAPPAAKSKAGLFIVAAVLVVLRLGGGVAGFLIWKSMSAKTAATVGPSTDPNRTIDATPREITSYWLELAPAKAGGKPARVDGSVPLASGQLLKFHFVFSENGYLYIFGPGRNNQLTAFLTAKPLPDSGVTSNKVVQGQDFSFPNDTGDERNDLTLDTKPGSDNFTVIFSKTALTAPAFLNEPVTGEPLSAAQQADLKAFAAKYQEKAPLIEHDESTAGAPAMRVKVPPDQTGNPIVFDIRIQHK